MPRALNLPGCPTSGIRCRRTGCGRYVSVFSSSWSLSRCHRASLRTPRGSDRLYPRSRHCASPSPMPGTSSSVCKPCPPEWSLLAPVGLIQSASLLGQSLLGLPLNELVLVIGLAPLASCCYPTTFAGRLPQPTRLPLARSRGFHPALGTVRPSDYSHQLRFPLRLPAYGVAYCDAGGKSPGFKILFLPRLTFYLFSFLITSRIE